MLLMASSVFGDVHYITPTGAGSKDGSDWSNAFEGMPASLTRGDTYYIAEGEYGAYTFDDNESGTTYIYIKKCGTTDEVCTAATGYSAADHDGQAVFTSPASSSTAWLFTKSYYDIDGVTGGGPTAWTSGHGILAHGADATPSSPTVSIYCPSPVESNVPAHHIRIIRTEIKDMGRDYNCVAGSATYATVKYPGMDCSHQATDGGYYFGYNYVHDSPSALLWGMNIKDSTFEYNYFSTNAAYINTESCDSNTQGAGVVSYGWNNVDFRYNVITDIISASPVLALYTWHGCYVDGSPVYPTTNMRVYGNLFFDPQYSDPDVTSSNGIIAADGCTSGPMGGCDANENTCDGTRPTISDLYIYNNTVTNMKSPDLIDIPAGQAGSNIYARNNVWFLNEGITVSNGAFTNVDLDYDIFFGNVAYQTSAGLEYSTTATFENYTDGVPAGWTKVDCNTEETSSYIPASPVRDLTNNAVKVTGTANNGHIYNDYTVTASTMYKVTFVFKNEAGDEARYWIYDNTNDAPIGEAGGYALTSQTSYKRYTTWFTTPAGCTSMRFKLGVSTSGDIAYYDSIYIKPSIDTNLGTLESGEQVITVSPFTDWGGADFTLSANTTAGADLGATYNTDAYETTRTNWDRGAYEYQSADVTAPAVSAFTTPETVSSLTVLISSFTCTDAVGVTGYCVNESSEAPTVGSCSGSGWAVTVQSGYTAASTGEKTLYAWCKDAAGNISTSANDTTTITLPSSSTSGCTISAGGTGSATKGTGSGSMTYQQ